MSPGEEQLGTDTHTSPRNQVEAGKVAGKSCLSRLVRNAWQQRRSPQKKLHGADDGVQLGGIRRGQLQGREWDSQGMRSPKDLQNSQERKS